MKKPEIEILEFYPVCTWAYDAQTETCAICRNSISDICVQCQKNDKALDYECKIAWGECSHAFHEHCINKWLKNRPLCPLDAKPWVYKK